MLEFTVNGQTLLRTDKIKVVNNSQNYLYASFNLVDEFNGTVSACFSTFIDGVKYGTQSTVIDGKCSVPNDVLTSDGNGLYISLIMTDGDILITTNELYIKQYKSGIDDGVLPDLPDSSDNQYIEFTNMYNEVMASTTEVNTRLDNMDDKIGTESMTLINKYNNLLNSASALNPMTAYGQTTFTYDMGLDGYRHYIFTINTAISSTKTATVGGDYRNASFSNSDILCISYKSTSNLKVKIRTYDKSMIQLTDIEYSAVPSENGVFTLACDDTTLTAYADRIAYIGIVQFAYKDSTAGYFDIYNFAVYDVEQYRSGTTMAEKIVLIRSDIAGMDTFKMNYLYVSPIYSISTGGFGITRFNNIYNANTSITDNSEKNRYTIIVAQGTYTDLQTRYAGTYSGAYEGIICKDYVYYESENINRPDLCILMWDGATGFSGDITIAMLSDKCLFHIVGDPKGIHTHIRGFTLMATNTRYCLHIESNWFGVDMDWSVDNCVLIWNGRPNETDEHYNAAAIGMGSGYFEVGTFKNCKIINNEAGNTMGINIHDNPWANGYGYTPYMLCGANINVEDCDMSDTSIMVTSTNNIIYNTSNIINLKNSTNISMLKSTTTNTQCVAPWRAIVQACDIADNYM